MLYLIIETQASKKYLKHLMIRLIKSVLTLASRRILEAKVQSKTLVFHPYLNIKCIDLNSISLRVSTFKKVKYKTFYGILEM